MTIAMGLLAEDGLVVATDTQETIPNYMKVSQGKVALVEFGGRTMAIAGAGSGAYVDALSEDLAHAFMNAPRRGNLRAHIGKTVRAFYTENVLPFSMYPEHGQPDVAMLMAYQHGGYQGILTTEKMAVRHCPGFGAIGSGEMYARSLLNIWAPPADWHRMRLSVAVIVAAFVIYRVKATIDGCGDATQLCCVRGGRPSAPLSRDECSELDATTFKDFDEVQCEALYWTLSASPRAHKRAMSAEFERIRTAFGGWIARVEHRLPKRGAVLRPTMV